jgi:dihydroneopterin aldolase
MKAPKSKGSVSARAKPKMQRRGGGRYRILVKDLIMPASIGVHRHEHDAPQRIRINLELDVHEYPLPLEDELANVVCYEDIVVRVRAIVGRGHTNLVESLAADIASACLSDRRVESVRVRVEKLDVFADTASVGVEIHRDNRRP